MVDLTEEEMAQIAAMDRKKRYYNFPRWAVRLFMPLIRMNYEKQPWLFFLLLGFGQTAETAPSAFDVGKRFFFEGAHADSLQVS